MKRARLKAALAFPTLIFLGVLAAAEPAQAAGPDPAAEAQRLLTKLDVPATRAVVQDPVAKAKAAQQRAQNARGAGDLRHATELDALALTWAQVADDLVRTAEAEKKLSDLQKTVSDLEQKAVRTQALIEQTIARKGRAEQNLAHEPALGSAEGGEKKTPPPNPGRHEAKAAGAKPAGAKPIAAPPAPAKAATPGSKK
ncbi:MAG: hypothetical protein ABI488_10725 [Polyangiaceae bacterium]